MTPVLVHANAPKSEVDAAELEFPFGFWLADGGQLDLFAGLTGEPQPVRYEKVLRDLQRHHINAVIPTHRALTREDLDRAQMFGIRMATMPLYLYSRLSHFSISEPESLEWVNEQWTTHIKKLMEGGPHPALLAYHVFDEPLPSMSSDINAVTDHIRKIDPNHPVIYTHQNLMLNETERPEEWALLKSLPVILSDFYGIREPWGRDPWIYGDVVVPEFARANPHAHQWAIIQSFGYGQVPTLGEIRVNVYNTIASGAKGIFFFTTGQTYVTWHDRGIFIAPGNFWFSEDTWLKDISRIGEHLTTAGPLLLPLKHMKGYRVQVSSEVITSRLQNVLRSGGPIVRRNAINAGAFVGESYDILVVHNNDPWKTHAGSVTVSGRRHAFDLLTLQQVGTPTVKGVTFPVEFEAGDGRLYLLGDDESFNSASAVILDRRYKHIMITINDRMKLARNARVNLGDIESVLASAEAAHQQGNHTDALALAQSALDQLSKQESADKKFQSCHIALDAMRADFLRISDRLVASPEYLQPTFPDHAAIADLTEEVMQLTSDFGKLENEVNAGTLKVKQAELLREKVANTSARFLAFRPTQLQSAKIAILQIGDETEGIAALSRWLGMLYSDVETIGVDQIQNIGSESYDLIWIHLDGNSSAINGNYCQRIQLPDDLVTGEAAQAINKFVQGGGGFICTGIAAGLTKQLGLEDRMPGDTYWGTMFAPGDIAMARQSWAVSGKVIGVKPLVSEHPLFKGFPAEGFGLESFDEAELISRAVWKRQQGGWPKNGTVLAGYYTDGADIPNDYAVVVEYQVGDGKYLFFGDGLDLALGSTTPSGLRGRLSRWDSPFHQLLMNIVNTYRRSDQF